MAIASLEKALAIDPAYKNAYIFRGAIYYDIKNFAASKKDMEKVLQLDPGNKFAVSVLSKISAQPQQ